MLTAVVVALVILAPTQEAAPARSFGSSPSTSEGAKRDAAEGKFPYRQLTWDDFTVKDNPPTRHTAWTEAFINYNYRWRVNWSSRKYEAKVSEWEVRSGFDKAKMWRRQQLPNPERLLVHEQGHLDINEIEARKLRRLRLSDLPFGVGASVSAAEADLKARINRLIEDAIREAQRQQSQYDEETFHGLRQTKQEAWTLKLRKALGAG